MELKTLIKMLAGSATILLLIMFLTVLSPSSIEEQKMLNENYTPTEAENDSYNVSQVFKNVKNFIFSYPVNLIIGLSLILLSIIGSYYSKLQTKIGGTLRTIGPAQGYIFGIGLMLLLTISPIFG